MTRMSETFSVSVDHLTLISLKDLADRLGRSKRTVQRYLREGKLLEPIRIKRNP